jgi:hypothetical protein
MLPDGNLHVVPLRLMYRVQHEFDPETLLLNVAVIPPDNVANESIALSRRAKSLGGLFELDRATRLPHLTIYMARFSHSKVDAVRRMLSTIIPTFEEQTVNHTGYYLTPNRYYEISYARTPGLVLAQANITKKLCELRHSPGNPVIENYFGEYKGKTKNSVERWGYDLVGNLYRPHLTLTRFSTEPQAVVAPASLPKSLNDLSFTLSTVGLFRADSMGSARELISEWKLG